MNRKVRPAIVGIGLVLSAMNACLVMAQSAQEFVVASIKLNRSGGRTDITTSPGGRLNATNVSLRILIQYAFGVKDTEIAGGPDWLGTERYDIAARSDSP